MVIVCGLKGKDKIKLANEQMKKMFDVERSKLNVHRAMKTAPEERYIGIS